MDQDLGQVTREFVMHAVQVSAWKKILQSPVPGNSGPQPQPNLAQHLAPIPGPLHAGVPIAPDPLTFRPDPSASPGDSKASPQCENITHRGRRPDWARLRSRNPLLGNARYFAMNDVLLSVWNRFHSREQLNGFLRAGLNVHWIGNTRPPTGVSRRSFQWISWALLRAHFLFSPNGFNRPTVGYLSSRRILVHLSMRAFDWGAANCRWDARVVWAYADINAKLLAAARRRSVPSVLDVPIGHQRDHMEMLRAEHHAWGLPEPGGWDESWARLCEEQYASADWISAGSTFVKRTLVDRGIPAEKVLVNPYGVDAARWRRCAERPRDYSGKLTFVFTANLTLRKGIHYLLKAWNAAALRNAELLIFGNGTLDLTRIVGQLPESVRFIGYADHDKLAAVYSRAHAYILPSLFEGLARSGLEAMAAGLPVIVTEETGLRDFVEDGQQGWFVPSRSVDALAERLRWCTAHREELKTAAERAFQKVQSLTFDSYGDRCAAIVRALIAGRSPAETW